MEQHPEQYNGTYELVASEDYTARTPKDPTYFFLIDISRSSFDSNIPFYALSAVKDAIENIRFNGGTNANIGIAFFDTSVHFLDMSGKDLKLFTFLPDIPSEYKLPSVS